MTSHLNAVSMLFPLHIKHSSTQLLEHEKGLETQVYTENLRSKAKQTKGKEGREEKTDGTLNHARAEGRGFQEGR